jgi:hypothetical protein
MLRDSHELCNLLIYLPTSVVYFNIYLHLYFNLKKLTLSHYFFTFSVLSGRSKKIISISFLILLNLILYSPCSQLGVKLTFVVSEHLWSAKQLSDHILHVL